MEKPLLLDIGCGTGVPTIELANLSSGAIVAVDIDHQALARLREKVTSSPVGGRVKTVRASLFRLCFRANSFDIVWAEGSVNQIGFEHALKKWRDLLVPDGFLVIHDSLVGHEGKLRRIPDYGYQLFSEFTLSTDVWWQEYCEPMKRYIESLSASVRANPAYSADIRTSEREVARFHTKPHEFSSFYAIMQKSERPE
jgi:ubiquinone/menaquinone biosynthesis C-methylase UbiE